MSDQELKDLVASLAVDNKEMHAAQKETSEHLKYLWLLLKSQSLNTSFNVFASMALLTNPGSSVELNLS